MEVEGYVLVRRKTEERFSPMFFDELELAQQHQGFIEDPSDLKLKIVGATLTITTKEYPNTLIIGKKET